jgi:hypothetical protein
VFRIGKKALDCFNLTHSLELEKKDKVKYEGKPCSVALLYSQGAAENQH